MCTTHQTHTLSSRSWWRSPHFSLFIILQCVIRFQCFSVCWGKKTAHSQKDVPQPLCLCICPRHPGLGVSVMNYKYILPADLYVLVSVVRALVCEWCSARDVMRISIINVHVEIKMLILSVLIAGMLSGLPWSPAWKWCQGPFYAQVLMYHSCSHTLRNTQWERERAVALAG